MKKMEDMLRNKDMVLISLHLFNFIQENTQDFLDNPIYTNFASLYVESMLRSNLVFTQYTKKQAVSRTYQTLQKKKNP